MQWSTYWIALLPAGGDLARRFRHRLQEDYIVIPRLLTLSWPFPFLPCWSLRLIHDASRKRGSPEYRDGLLVSCRNIIHSWSHLWCVLLVHGMSLIHDFNIRSVSCNLLRIDWLWSGSQTSRTGSEPGPDRGFGVRFSNSLDLNLIERFRFGERENPDLRF